jgi:OOP family OmpA-OmpF porin
MSDGINDEDDKCIDVVGLARYNGCPIPDTDKDGVNDEDDKCINEPGLKENSGCPEIKKEIIQKVEFAARKIQFAFAKATLLPGSEKVLDDIADLLTKQPEIKIDIEGHTSSDGTLSANMKLSDNRADAVKNYLISKGVDASRITSQGYGPTKPLNEGKTEAEKALNRRVELKLRNN